MNNKDSKRLELFHDFDDIKPTQYLKIEDEKDPDKEIDKNEGGLPHGRVLDG